MAITETERRQLDELANLPAKVGPAQRVGRAAGQGATGYALVELAQAFDWFGSDRWSAEQAAERWPALTTAVVIGMATGHNVAPAVGRGIAEWWGSRRVRRAR